MIFLGSSSSVREELRNAFGPSRTSAAVATRRQGSLLSTRRARPRTRGSQERRIFTRLFCCLSDSNAHRVPLSEVVSTLEVRGLGVKEVDIAYDWTRKDIDSSVMETFPALEQCGGFELLRAVPSARTLNRFPDDMDGEYLSRHTRYNSKIYVRPIQRDIDVSKLPLPVCNIF